jgi:pimeloyl-[acyl-carrier protein] methyl ester esterase
MLRNAMRLFALILGLLAPGLAAHAAQPTRFTVEVRGKGPDVILIPGLASSRAVWDATAAQLEGRYRLHIVQVNGFAGAPAGANAQGPVVDGLVEEISAYIADQKLDHPAIIGHSMGGFTALALAQRHGDQVGKVMVVDALPFFSVLLGPGTTVKSVEPQAARIRDSFAGMTDEQMLKLQTDTMQRLVKDPKGRADAVAWSMASDRKVVGEVTYEVMTSDLRPQLGSITTPVTVLYARDDSMGIVAGFVDGLYRSNYDGLPNKHLVRIDGALHFIMIDQPEAFAREVEAFLK